MSALGSCPLSPGLPIPPKHNQLTNVTVPPSTSSSLWFLTHETVFMRVLSLSHFPSVTYKYKHYPLCPSLFLWWLNISSKMVCGRSLQVLWDPYCRQPPGSPSPWPREGGRACLHTQGVVCQCQRGWARGAKRGRM